MFKYLFLIFPVLCSCEKEYDETPEIIPLSTLVVEGIITNELKEQFIKLSFPQDSFNSQAGPVSGAQISVSDNFRTFVFKEDDQYKGHYYSQAFQGFAGRNYHLSIIFSGKLYEASASMIALATRDSFAFRRNGNLFNYIQLKSEDPVMIELLYEWPDSDYSAQRKTALEYLYTLSNIDINKSFAPDKESIWVPAGTKIIKKRYSLTWQHQEFLRSLLIETEWSGGLFDVQRANVNTNISNGGLGFFAACTVVTDTIVVK